MVVQVAETAFSANTYIPDHTKTLKYVLKGVTENINHVLSNALVANTYSLVQTATNLSGNQIAVELKHGDTSLGFLTYNNGNGIWGIQKDSNMTGTANGGIRI